MRQSKFAETQIVAILKEADAGRPVNEIWRQHGILAIEVETSLLAERVIRVLEQVTAWRGQPQAIRLDNGPEFLADRFAAWCQERQITLRYIQPGQPNQHAFIERFNRTFRHEVLDASVFES
jgi:putative transposase